MKWTDNLECFEHDYIQLSNNTTNDNSQLNKLNLCEVLKTNTKTLQPLENIEYQCVVIAHIKNTLKESNNCVVNDSVIENLEWLQNANTYLCKITGLDANLQSSSFRSSYKFCEHGISCKYNYGNISKKNTGNYKGCFKQHFVYDLLLSDIKATIKIINDHEKMEEITKSINTICYVIGKMKDELLDLKNKFGSKYTDYHKNSA